MYKNKYNYLKLNSSMQHIDTAGDRHGWWKFWNWWTAMWFKAQTLWSSCDRSSGFLLAL